jgi:hypothetical protein
MKILDTKYKEIYFHIRDLSSSAGLADKNEYENYYARSETKTFYEKLLYHGYLLFYDVTGL